MFLLLYTLASNYFCRSLPLFIYVIMVLVECDIGSHKICLLVNNKR